MSGRNTQEYRKLVAVTARFTDILAHGSNVVTLSQALFGAGFVSSTNNIDMANAGIPPTVRAAQLVGMVMTKVDLNSRNYAKFVDILKMDTTTYGEILNALGKYVST